MAGSIQGLERRRGDIVQEIGGLGDLRPGSITAVRKRCGKAGCCCAEPEHLGHGPQWRLTYKSGGKTHTQSLTGAVKIQKAEREIAEFRRFQQLSREFVEVSTRLCQLRPDEPVAPEEKKRPKRSKRKSPGK